MLTNEVIDVNIISNNETGEIEIIENKQEKEKEKEKDEYITSYHYYKDNKVIKKLKLPELKKTLKFYKNSMTIPNNSYQEIRKAKTAIKKIHDFTLGGDKKTIQNRLIKYFEQERLVIEIQKSVRRFFVKKLLLLIGPGFMNKQLCVNQSDFSTLEPLTELPIYDFFSYKDTNGKIYGFQLESIKMLIKKRRHKSIENPFNRENMNKYIETINSLTRINLIVQNKNVIKKRELVNQRVKPPSRTQNNENQLPYSTRMQDILYSEHNYDCEAMLQFIRTTRGKTIQERIRLLFVEIDQLGNYSNYEWFSSLDRRSFIRYFRILRDIWGYRAQMPSVIKFKICPLWDPFLILTDVHSLNELTIEQLQGICLSVMEDMVYTGVSNEFKTLGSIHILSVLTIVNHGARQALPWLYESLI